MVNKGNEGEAVKVSAHERTNSQIDMIVIINVKAGAGCCCSVPVRGRSSAKPAGPPNCLALLFFRPSPSLSILPSLPPTFFPPPDRVHSQDDSIKGVCAILLGFVMGERKFFAD